MNKLRSLKMQQQQLQQDAAYNKQMMQQHHQHMQHRHRQLTQQQVLPNQSPSYHNSFNMHSPLPVDITGGMDPAAVVSMLQEELL